MNTPTFYICSMSDDPVKYDGEVSMHDSGYNIKFPRDISIDPGCSIYDMEVKVACMMNNKFSAFHVLPRSRIGNTSLMMANSIGLIDSEYTGNIKIAIRNFSSDVYEVKKGESLFQVCAYNLVTPIIKVVNKNSEEYRLLFPATERGDGGFGSTGK